MSAPRGRPRSAERHHTILESTRTLLAELTYDQLTVDAIAATAGVSRQTVTKWWPSKAAVVTEAVMSGYVSVNREEPRDTGDLSADLGAWLHAMFDEVDQPRTLALIRAMTAAAADGTDSERIYKTLTLPHREYLLDRLEAASRQGQLRPDADLEAVIDAIIGSVLLRTLSHGVGRSVPRARGLIDVLLDGIRVPTGPGRRQAR